MQRPIARLFFFFCLSALAPHAVAAAEPAFTGEQRADLARISAYLNGIHSLSGHFLQVGPDGAPQEGTFYIKKPGRLRFEYDKPSPVLVVADGSTIAVMNSKLRTTDRYPLLNSPLRVILSDNVDLASDSRIASVSREPGAVSVVARQNSGPAQGQITLTFADSGTQLELRQWQVLDAQNMRTVVVVSDLKSGVDLPTRLFVIQDLSPFSHGGE
jgi:outer membrane lipoprotein-sorting protein